nr:DUF2971 domain-containing protein [uncultured Clostridium sp.]
MPNYIEAIKKINSKPMDIETERLVYMSIKKEIPNTLYKYYSLTNDDELNKNKLDTLLMGKVYLSRAEDFNDPFDSKAIFYDLAELIDFADKAGADFNLNEDLSRYKLIACFTSNGINCMPMWGNYANNHEGFCVAYNMKSILNIPLGSIIFPVQYIDERLDITSAIKEKIENAIIENNTVEFARYMNWVSTYYNCIKHSSWSYENEFRCPVPINAPGIPYLMAYPKEIFVGAKCGVDNKERLVEIARKMNISIYQMRFDQFSPKYELNYVEL